MRVFDCLGKRRILSMKGNKGLLRVAGEPLFLSGFLSGVFSGRARQSGSVLVYVFVAIGLLAALTYSFTKDSRSGVAAHTANRVAQELYVQANLIRSAILECTLSYPGGGGDLDGDADIDADDNPNTPYPLQPDNALVPDPPGPVAGNAVHDVVCLKSSTETENIFQGVNNRGRFLPLPPAGFGAWTYTSHATDGVYVEIETTGVASATEAQALDRLVNKFAACQASVSCGATCTFRVWVDRKVACP